MRVKASFSSRSLIAALGFLVALSSSVGRAESALPLSVDDGSAWRSTQSWNEDWEARYSRWIVEEFNEDFFIKGRWAGISTDCADAVYAARIIFSYDNKLPFALSGSKEREAEWANSSKDFAAIKDPDSRVRAFIRRLNSRTWTGSLEKHTAPIAITRDTVRPGTLWLKPGHVEVIKTVRENGVLELQGSWLPAAVRQMITITSLGHAPLNMKTGFRRWLWPGESAPEPKPQAADYRLIGDPTEAKSESGIRTFEESVQLALAQSGLKESKGSRVQRLAHDFCRMAHARAEVVRLGREFMERRAQGKTAQACMIPRDYHLYSTPSRDSNLRRVVWALGSEFSHNQIGFIRMLLASCPVIEGEGFRIDPSDFLVNLLRFNFSSDPHEPEAVRFGTEAPQSVCPMTY